MGSRLKIAGLSSRKSRKYKPAKLSVLCNKPSGLCQLGLCGVSFTHKEASNSCPQIHGSGPSEHKRCDLFGLWLVLVFSLVTASFGVAICLLSTTHPCWKSCFFLSSQHWLSPVISAFRPGQKSRRRQEGDSRS